MRSPQARYGLVLVQQCLRCAQGCEVDVRGRLREHGDDVDVATTGMPVVQCIRADDVQTLDEPWRSGVEDLEIRPERRRHIHR